MCTLPPRDEEGDTLPSCFCSHTINHCHFTVHLVLCGGILVLSDGGYLFQMTPKHSAEVLSSVFKLKKAGMCLMKKICVT